MQINLICICTSQSPVALLRQDVSMCLAVTHN
ncbi:hypothetical protein Paride_0370 [Pseudomonas phage Paride]|nr:hypothetical protein Paride_0370 [Pseudomonas phage Paride]